MKYLKAVIELNEEGLEPVIARLMENGFSNFAVEDPKDIEEIMNRKNSYDWDYIDDEVVESAKCNPKIIIYLDDIKEDSDDIKTIKSMLLEIKNDLKKGEYGKNVSFGALELNCTDVDDVDWKDKWKEYFKPTKVSETIVVKPTWEEFQPKNNENVIEIDPGMAFGTGTHETTSLCIKMLEKYISEGDKVLDVGCGSGILSIASGLLGASEVLAVDIDPMAVKITKENVLKNNMQRIISTQTGDLTNGINYKANVVVANLMADLVAMLSEDVSKHLLSDGIFISSGILEEKEEFVSNALIKAGFEIIEIAKDGMWIAIVAKQTK